ncbi:putative hydroxypyruvate isomerase [Amyelois transitella]|uniref:putative hydroxypyruvate isomerase n=1 Tax=Amyelois transitella TaxID=680683 RepID=UPI00298FB20A|nr:putative hydroxypyruvate isomerase [Amyelois transitella]
MKFCANLFFMFPKESTMAERYALAKEVGFKAVESRFPMGHTVSEVKQIKENSGLQLVMLNLKTGDVSKGELGVTAIPGKESVFKDILRETIEYATALDAQIVHIMAGQVVSKSLENWNTYEKNLRYAAAELGKYNLMGVIEPVCQYAWPKYYLNDFFKAVEIIKKINSPNLKLLLDIFHLQHIHGDLYHNIKLFMPYVGHVQIAQVPNRHEPDTPGEINYQYVLKLLQDFGYKGWVGLEYIPKGDLKEGLKWIKNYGYSL